MQKNLEIQNSGQKIRGGKYYKTDENDFTVIRFGNAETQNAR